MSSPAQEYSIDEAHLRPGSYCELWDGSGLGNAVNTVLRRSEQQKEKRLNVGPGRVKRTLDLADSLTLHLVTSDHLTGPCGTYPFRFHIMVHTHTHTETKTQMSRLAL